MLGGIRRVWGQGRRGAVVVLVAVTGTLMAGFAALTIDLGNLYVVRTELQRTADAAALGAASVYFSDAGLSRRESAITAAAYDRGKTIAQKNSVLGHGLILDSTDVNLGRHDFSNPAAALSSSSTWNAAQVTARRTTESANGPVPFFFANIWGKSSGNLIATATAAVEDRVAGYKLDGNLSGMGFLPFAIPEEGYYDLIRNGPDQYSFNNAVSRSADGIREVQMYPWKWTSAGGVLGTAGSGNFGTLDIGRTSNGTPDIVAQINQGIPPSALEVAFHTTALTFYDATHTAATGPRIYPCSGDPGMSTAVGNTLVTKVGKTYGFFMHRGLQSTGNNTTYAVSGIFYARIMAVDLTGGPNAPGLIIQPVGYTDNWVVTSPNAPATYRTLGRILLVQ